MCDLCGWAMGQLARSCAQYFFRACLSACPPAILSVRLYFCETAKLRGCLSYFLCFPCDIRFASDKTLEIQWAHASEKQFKTYGLLYAFYALCMICLTWCGFPPSRRREFLVLPAREYTFRRVDDALQI